MLPPEEITPFSPKRDNRDLLPHFRSYLVSVRSQVRRASPSMGTGVDDLDMCCNFAELCGGKILELACGSGRLLLPLAREGYQLTGVDTSAAMLELAQHSLAEAGVAGRCQLVQQCVHFSSRTNFIWP